MTDEAAEESLYNFRYNKNQCSECGLPYQIEGQGVTPRYAWPAVMDGNTPKRKVDKEGETKRWLCERCARDDLKRRGLLAGPKPAVV